MVVMSAAGRVGRRMVVVGLVVAAGCFGLTFGATSAAAASARAHAQGCAVAHSRTVLSSALVRVYRVGSRFYGCLRRSGRVRALDGNFKSRALGGTWVARSKYLHLNGIPPENKTWVVATDLQTGKRSSAFFIDSGDFPDALAVSRRGTMAWLLRDVAPQYGTSDDTFLIPSLGSSGRPALATFDNGLSIARAAGSGFSSFVPVPGVDAQPGMIPRTAEAADVTGDGVSDLVLLTLSGLVIVPGNADGTFGPEQVLTLHGDQINDGDPPGYVAVADLDRDGHPDIVVARQRLWVLRGLGGLAFAPPVIVASPDLSGDLVPGPCGGCGFVVPIARDVDGDTIPDISVLDDFGGRLLFHGNGDGTFKKATGYLNLSAGSDPAIADVNHDGIPDIVSSHSSDGAFDGIAVLIGRGRGRFAPPKTYGKLDPPPQDVGSIGLADVNGDGNADVVAVIEYTRNRQPDVVRAIVFVGHHDGTFTAPKLPAMPLAEAKDAGGGDFELVDVNGDGKLDVLTDGGVVLLGRGNGTFPATTRAYDVFVRPVGGKKSELASAVKIDAGSLRFRGDQLTATVAGTRTPTHLG